MNGAPKEKHSRAVHSLPPEKWELFNSLEDWAESTLLPYLKPIDKCWQPQDYLPDPSSEGFMDEVKELQERAAGLPDDYLVCLVGDMITEEALPTYQSMLNTLHGTRDETGASPSPWGIWTRAWTAEENRHGDLLNKYLYLTGRVDMRQIEKTIQYLIGSGMVHFLLSPFSQVCGENMFWHPLLTRVMLELNDACKKGSVAERMSFLFFFPAYFGTVKPLISKRSKCSMD